MQRLYSLPHRRGIFKSLMMTSFQNHSLSQKAKETTVDEDEVKKFNALSKLFWDCDGPFGPLHHLNSLRVPFARDGLLNSKQVPMEARAGPHPLKGYAFVDVGCGAGLYSEPLARIGANVTGIDAAPDVISVARKHAALDCATAERLLYINTTVEEHAKEHTGKYDALVCSEVIEHVSNPSLFVKHCAELVKQTGSLFFTTMNRNWLCWFYNVLLAESAGFAPKGAHQYDSLMPPEDLEQMLVSNGCAIRKVHGMIFFPIGQWIWVKSTTLSYALHAIKT